MTKSETFLSNLSRGVKDRASRIFQRPYSKVNINWAYLKYLKHLPPNRVHSHRLLNHKTFFRGGPEYLHGLREIFIDDIYKQRLPENAYILDCGAHIGLSVIYLKKLCPSARIIAFEPDQENYSLLVKNISSHKLDNIDAKQEAVWIEDTNLQFIQNGNMESRIGIGSDNTKIVSAVRLKNFLGRAIDFLKLDIEGAEYKVIKDIADNLHNVNNLFIEFHGTFSQNNDLLEILEIVNKAGFKFYIKEASDIFKQPFFRERKSSNYDVQLNIFCFKE